MMGLGDCLNVASQGRGNYTYPSKDKEAEEALACRLSLYWLLFQMYRKSASAAVATLRPAL